MSTGDLVPLTAQGQLRKVRTSWLPCLKKKCVGYGCEMCRNDVDLSLDLHLSIKVEPRDWLEAGN
jgi:hypothetical protein